MSEDNFLSFLQQLLTMVDPQEPASVELAKTALDSVVALAKESAMADAVVMQMMRSAQNSFRYLVKSRNDFAGRKGQYARNNIKRARLRNALCPHC